MVPNRKTEFERGDVSMHGKYSEAIGAFWGASFFIGALVSIFLIFDGTHGWIKAVLVGVCVFLILGLSLQGLITLLRKD